jgi:prepilin-type N-terminal cleavage/methylation domain-containing protein
MQLVKSNRNKFRGFTLVEVLVAVALFVTVVVLALGALFSAQTLNARLNANQSILEGMNLSLEVMSRQIRYGSIFNCDSSISSLTGRYRKSCPFDITVPYASNPGQTLVFKPIDAAGPDDRVGFYLQNSKIYQWSYVGGVVQESVPITSDEVVIDTLQFFVTGANTTQQAVDNGNNENIDSTVDTLQPIIILRITGKTLVKKRGAESVNFQLQTTITPRGIDN